MLYLVESIQSRIVELKKQILLCSTLSPPFGFYRGATSSQQSQQSPKSGHTTEDECVIHQ